MENLEQIDQLLADWKKKVDIIGQNLMDLYELPTYQRLAGTVGFPKAQLTGITQARVTQALETIGELFQFFSLLMTTVKQATELRKQVSWFLGSEQKVHQLAELLTGKSIQLPTIQTPLAQRGLLSATESSNSIAPEQLLRMMTKEFTLAKNVIIAVDEVWLRLEPILADTEDEIGSLQKLAESLGVSSLNELSAARQKLASLRANINSDPLGVSADFNGEINPVIKRVKSILEVLVKQQSQLRDNITQAYDLLNKLVEQHLQASAAFAERTEKISEYSREQTPLDGDKIEALSQWLTRLETKFAEGLLNPVSVGLGNWTAKVKEYIAVEQAAYAANNAPLEMRKELRGRLEALKVKAMARGLAEDTTLTQLAQQAKELLYSRPTPLAKAAELVSQYEKRLLK